MFVEEQLLRHINGFECLIAPYTIGHLELSQYLNDRYKYKLTAKAIFWVYHRDTWKP